MSKRTKLLLKENNELENRLKRDDEQALTNITVYIRSANISPYFQESVRRDVLEMIINGEKEGRSMIEIIGEDYKIFCDNVIAEIPELTGRERMLTAMRDTLLSVTVLMGLWFVFRIIGCVTGYDSWPYFTVTAGNVISGVFIIIAAFYVFSFVSKHSFSNSRSLSGKILLALCLVLFVCVCANVFIQYPFFQVHGLILAAALAVLFILYKILDVRID
ncbi:hypothetical protein [Cuneatibacter caecimuris]|uniref:DNA-binding ferritin-like protein (Dps family) n=1 Tax=Cuneatibacter caecimuris TaxID=1796618 RepID=A0A4Q7P287_9FIRM|nr:hypothetical protein [Cuneatibacter caecimuris]RZS94003.1 DNA-binding ferritin-like protein (Dps family) [Cuneatibacter caecimuris]